MAIRNMAFVALAALSLPVGAASQVRAREWGIDGAVSFTATEDAEGVESPNVQTWAFPVQRARAGQWITRRFQVQLSSGFSVADFGDISTVRFALAVAGLYHLTGDATRSGVFLTLGAGFDLLSHDGTDVQWTGVGGVGAKLPVGTRFAFRPALEVGRSPRSERRLAATTVSAVFGASVFTGVGGDP